MATINIVRPIDITMPDYSVRHFGVGQHEVDDDLAKNPFLLAQSDNPPEVQAKVGTPAYAEQQMRQVAAARTAKAVEDDQVNAAAAQARKQARAQVDTDKLNADTAAATSETATAAAAANTSSGTAASGGKK